MAHHAHAPPARAGSRHLRRLATVFALVATVMVAEVVTGVLTGSLALLSDAGHMAADALGLGMALAAIVAADRAGVGGRRTFGLYRLEILAALANAIVLIGVAGYVLFEAFRRLGNPVDVETGPMLAMAVVGLVVNVLGWRLLREGAAESLNVEGAFLEIVADLVGSIGVIAAGLIVRFAGWTYADPLIAAAIASFILPRAWRLGRRAVDILIQAAPPGIDLDEMGRRLGEITGVVDVHDLHVWMLTSDMPVASVHLMTREGVDGHRVLDAARNALESDYGIAHATLQVEPDTHSGCMEVAW